MIERPADRYGRQHSPHRNRRWAGIAVLVTALVIGLIVAIVAFQRFGSSDVEGELSAYRLVDDETVEVTIAVTRSDPAVPAVCIVRSRSQDGSETGRREVLVPPSSQATVQVTTIVKSTRTPAAGDVYGCGIDVPAYLQAP